MLNYNHYTGRNIYFVKYGREGRYQRSRCSLGIPDNQEGD
jgi:hypothetical protein